MAVRMAIDLMHMPSRVRMVRSEPLPTGVHELLCIAAGDEAAECAAIESTGRSRDVIRSAAAFFIEQVLLCANADSYRVLGASREATNADLRRNMALLMKWLHPDLDPDGRRSVFVNKVTLAWNDLKSAERRAAYDLERSKRVKPKRRSSGKRRSASRHVLGQSLTPHIHGDCRKSVLRRLAAWMGAMAQLYSR